MFKIVNELWIEAHANQSDANHDYFDKDDYNIHHRIQYHDCSNNSYCMSW